MTHQPPRRKPMIVNATPHGLNIYMEDGTIRSVSPAFDPAPRVEQRMVPIGTVDGVPIVRVEYGAADSLPIRPGVCYVVSALYAQAVVGRDDIYVPADPVRDPDGRIVGCRALARLTRE